MNIKIPGEYQESTSNSVTAHLNNVITEDTTSSQWMTSFLQQVSNSTFCGSMMTTMGSEHKMEEEVAVTSLSRSQFYVAHITGICSLVVSTTVSVSLLIHLLKMPGTRFFTRNIGERLTIYLSICDLSYCICHLTDHFYIIATGGQPDPVVCAVIGALVFEFYIAQVLVVTSIAINSFLMVVIQVRIGPGRCDSTLLTISFGLPALATLCAGPLNIFGPGGQGTWCVLNDQTAGSFSTFLACAMAVLFINNTLMYILIWLKLRRNAMAVGLPRKYDGVAKLGMVFVGAYILPTGTYVVYSLVEMWIVPPYGLLLWTLVVTNLAGVFNYIAYTWARRKNLHSLSPVSSSCGSPRLRGMSRTSTDTLDHSRPAACNSI